jgi:hypothetical protein
MIFKKITHGFVIQTFNDRGIFLSQEFVSGDEVEYERAIGESTCLGGAAPESICSTDMPLKGSEYQPFNMVQKIADFGKNLY